MTVYSAGSRWSDRAWLDHRSLLWHALSQDDDVTVDLTACQWVDLHPLVDLLNRIVYRAAIQRYTFLALDPAVNPDNRRVTRFLLETGFLAATADHRPYCTAVNALGEPTTEQLLKGAGEYLADPPAISYATIVPCRVLDVRQCSQREDIFRFCNSLREECLANDRARALRLPVPLIYEVKLFLASVLPELLDNVRVHKPPALQQCCFYMRFRGREETRFRAPYAAEPVEPGRTSLQRMTARLWHHDVLEAVFSDLGPTIQETYIANWRRHHPEPKAVPILPETGTRVDGPNGDEIILRGVLHENATSLPPQERLHNRLPIRLTGLHMVRRSLDRPNNAFEVVSGENVIALDHTPDDAHDRTVPSLDHGRVPRADGVHYLFRLTAEHGARDLEWPLAFPDARSHGAIWERQYPDRYRHVHVTNVLEVPHTIAAGEVLVCRPHHVASKDQILGLLLSAQSRGVHLVFAELPVPVALRLSLILDLLIPTDVTVRCPVLTEGYRVWVPGPRSEEGTRSFIACESRPVHSDWWWTGPAPIRGAADVLRAVRQRDSEHFWDLIRRDPVSFSPEPVQWSSEISLVAGFLRLSAAIRERAVRKLVRRRVATLVHLLGCQPVAAVTESVRGLADELNRGICAPREGSTARPALLTGVRVTGHSLRAAHMLTPGMERALLVCVLEYPSSGVHWEPGTTHRALETQIPRALDWQVPVTCDHTVTGRHAPLCRIDNTESVSRRRVDPLPYESEQGAAQAYRVWQRHGLLSVGHFSSGRQHHFATIDLFSFLVDRSTDLTEMLDAMHAWTRRHRPDAIFYVPGDTAEALVGLLRAAATSAASEALWGRVLPLDSLHSLQHGDTLGAGRSALLLDDALVTGATLRQGKSILREYGFRVINTMVMLDRTDPRTALQSTPGLGEEHFAWWSCCVPPSGPRTSCPVCHGVSALRHVAEHTKPGALRDTLRDWARLWEPHSLTTRSVSPLERFTLSPPEERKLGDPSIRNVSLHSNHALCIWALDMMSRLNRMTYPFEEGHHGIKPALPEALCGMIIFWWHSLEHSVKRRLVEQLLDALWTDSRSAARAMVAVALATLPGPELRRVSELFADRVQTHGLPHFHAAAVGYALAHLAAEDHDDARSAIQRWRTKWSCRTPEADTPASRRLSALVDTLVSSEASADEDLSGFGILGLPGRSGEHVHLQDLVADLKTAQGAAWEHAVLLLSAYLDTVERMLRKHAHALESAGVLRAFQSAFARLREGVADRGETIARRTNVTIAAARLVSLLCVGGPGGLPSVRTVLARELAHYPPWLIRMAMRDLEQRGSIRPGDCVVEDPADTPEEHDLARARGDLIETDALVTQLQQYDLALAPRASLYLIITDCLLDLRHPRDAKLRMRAEADAPFMLVRAAMSPTGSGTYDLTFTNRATPEQYALADGRSWMIIQALSARSGGSAKQEYIRDSGILVRVVSLPGLRRRVTLVPTEAHQ